jgi:hypothetical protein
MKRAVGLYLETPVGHRRFTGAYRRRHVGEADAIERRANQQFQVVDDHLAVRDAPT